MLIKLTQSSSPSPLPPFTNLKWNWLEVEGSYFNKKNNKVIEKKLQILSQYWLDN